MKKRFLFVGSLPSKKFYFDGERNKSRDVLNALKKEYSGKFSLIDLSKNQFLQVLKMLLLGFFVKYDFVFVSKCLVGGSKAIKYLTKFSNKNNRKNIIFYIIGNGSNGFDDKIIYYDYVEKARFFIVESPKVKEELLKKEIAFEERIFIVPCVKPNYLIPPTKKEYPVRTLKLIYFSRVTEAKGILDAISAISEINEQYGKTLFTLDIAGGSGTCEHEQAFLQQVLSLLNGKDYLKYLGLSLRIEGEKSYKMLQNYDLHIFPSKFYQECAPGSVIDMFVAGVPTLSSNFPSSKYLMSDADSFFFELGNISSLKNSLLTIYNNQQTLNSKRINSSKNFSKYNEISFIKVLKEMLSKSK